MPAKGRFEFPAPRTPYPSKLRCVQFFLPDDPLWYSVFWGLLDELTFAKNWDTDKTTALAIAAHWNDVISAARLSFYDPMCGKSAPMGGAEGDDNLIRQDPDNPCLLQTSIDGINWCTFADFSKCLPASGQPGSGTPQPGPGGGTECIHAVLNSNSVWLLPVPVSTGDVIQINNASGSHSNSFDTTWRCPDGSQMFAGACVGFPFTEGTNPVPAAPTGALIIEIAGTFYALLPGPFTVPGGVTEVQPTIQVNDANISGLSGQLTFDVCVTNNQAGTFTHEFDLLTSPGGFSPGFNSSACPGALGANWQPGVGWVGQEFDCPPVTTDYMIDLIYQTFPARTLTSIEVQFAVVLGTHLVYFGNGDQVTLNIDTSPVAVLFSDYRTPPASPWIWTGSQLAHRLDVQLIADINQPSPPVGGSVVITKVIVTGQGTDPF